MTSGHNDGPALRGKPSRVQGGQEVAESVARELVRGIAEHEIEGRLRANGSREPPAGLGPHNRPDRLEAGQAEVPADRRNRPGGPIDEGRPLRTTGERLD